MFYDVSVLCTRDNGDRVRVVVQNLKAEGPEAAAEIACDFLVEGFAGREVESVEERKEAARV